MANQTVQIVPEGREWLSFSFSMPGDWRLVDVPAEDLNFDEPKAFVALSICAASYGAAVFSVGARPGYGDGTLRQWVEFLCSGDEFDAETIRPCRIGAIKGWIADGSQQGDDLTMTLRNYFIEDGGRLYAIGLMAAEPMWSAVEEALTEMAESFQLAEAKGPTVEFEPYVPAAAKEAALAEDAASLDDEHPMNARLRENGIGLVPRILDVNRDEKFATVGAGALGATMHVPLGWHVIDDGRRTLVFDAGGEMQISVNLRQREGKSDAEMIDGFIATYKEQQPGIPYIKLAPGGLESVAFRGLDVDGEKLDQVFILRRADTPDIVVVARVTAETERIAFALNAAEVMLVSMAWSAAA